MMKATKIPQHIPGIENEKLLIEIIVTKYGFLNPSARSIPYSYVFPSTSESIREKTSIEERMARKIMTVKKVAFKKS